MTSPKVKVIQEVYALWWPSLSELLLYSVVFPSVEFSSSEGAAESWLARLHPLSLPTLLPVRCPCQAPFFTLRFSFRASFEHRAFCCAPCVPVSICHTTVPRALFSSAGLLPCVPTTQPPMLSFTLLSHICVFPFKLSEAETFFICTGVRLSFR